MNKSGYLDYPDEGDDDIATAYASFGEHYYNGEDDPGHTLEPDYEALAYGDEDGDGCGQYGPDTNINFEPPF